MTQPSLVLQKVEAWINSDGELFLTISDDRIRDEVGRKKELIIPLASGRVPSQALRRILEVAGPPTSSSATDAEQIRPPPVWPPPVWHEPVPQYSPPPLPPPPPPLSHVCIPSTRGMPGFRKFRCVICGKTEKQRYRDVERRAKEAIKEQKRLYRGR